VNGPKADNTSTQLTSSDEEAIQYFRASITGGHHWYISLLETVGKWQSKEEIHGGRHYRYLIEGEAFDWMLLAERLLETVEGIVAEEEKASFLLRNQPPLDINRDHFRDYFGEKRYRQHLNFYYGVTVERALVRAVQEEIRKERTVAGYVKEQENADEAFRRIYGDTETALLAKFRKERHYRTLKSISLEDYKEFTYWLFKYRIKNNDRERVASDTRKAIDWVNRNGLPQGMFNGNRIINIDGS
jgi:hypothetical protein